MRAKGRHARADRLELRESEVRILTDMSLEHLETAQCTFLDDEVRIAHAHASLQLAGQAAQAQRRLTAEKHRWDSTLASWTVAGILAAATVYWVLA